MIHQTSISYILDYWAEDTKGTSELVKQRSPSKLYEVSPESEKRLSKQLGAQLIKPETTTGQQQLKLRLSNAVVLALQNNRALKNAYLGRIAQRQDLVVAEDRFVPDFTPEIGVAFDRNGDITSRGYLGLGARVSVRLPTGAELEAGWRGEGAGLSAPLGLALAGNEDSLSQSMEFSFNQPLLRGFGSAVNKASINIARLQ